MAIAEKNAELLIVPYIDIYLLINPVTVSVSSSLLLTYLSG